MHCWLQEGHSKTKSKITLMSMFQINKIQKEGRCISPDEITEVLSLKKTDITSKFDIGHHTDRQTKQKETIDQKKMFRLEE